MKEDDPEFEEADWGIDDGFFRAYKDGFPVPAGTAQPPEETGDVDEDYLGLSESVRAHLGDLLRLERSVSAQRRMLHARIDFIRTQGTQSHVVAQQVTYLMKKERALSDQRALLHNEIDELRGGGHMRTPRTSDPAG